ncbi:hypothetical protein SDC9_81548 [bioreactor metagenome]|uniref:Uncharacterized protein n=1 Tax=bioreactor metagenome TaxID=1076179 RepID=A0A644Z3U9_9ZZZZ
MFSLESDLRKLVFQDEMSSNVISIRSVMYRRFLNHNNLQHSSNYSFTEISLLHKKRKLYIIEYFPIFENYKRFIFKWSIPNSNVNLNRKTIKIDSGIRLKKNKHRTKEELKKD